MDRESSSSWNCSCFIFFLRISRASRFLGRGIVVVCVAFELDRPGPSTPGCLSLDMFVNLFELQFPHA